ncbi:MAG: glycoside hydrolase family 71/99-like protein, partial [Oscillospiraceae bacterium]|nr:glycoside hydrolase family 71/99-like protein [Oscillospiraceae bacterium]
MRKLLCTVISVLILLSAPVFYTIGSADDGVYIVFENPLVRDGIRLINRTGDNRYNFGTAAGSPVLNIEAYAYFAIEYTPVRNAPDVTLEITYFDNNSNSMRLEYMSTIGTGTDARYRGIILPRHGTREFITTRLTIPSCNFSSNQTQNYGGHFRIGNGGILQSMRIWPGAMPDDTVQAPPKFAASTEHNNMIGKGMTGYQAWFRAGENEGDWTHWGAHGKRIPEKDGSAVEVYPDVDDYIDNGAVLYDTNFAPLGDGRRSRLFNSTDDAIIGTHFEWMRQNRIDGAAVQRFVGYITTIKTTAKNHLQTIKEKAEENGRLFYVMYDMSGGGGSGDALVRELQLDFIYNAEDKGLVSSPAYAQVDGKPVVCFWGISRNSEGSNRYPSAEVMTELIDWFRNRGYYIIGGIPDNDWTQRTDGYAAVYRSLDMASPWTVGRYRANNAENWLVSRVPREIEFCNENGIEYQPVVFPGFAWTNLGNDGNVNDFPRNAGQFVWQQVYTLKNRWNVRNVYFAMFDEYDEATSWMKAGRDYFDIPTDQYFLTHSADGIWLSSDYYMRTAGAALDMLKGITPLRHNIDIPHSNGPLYWRNSFESRETDYYINRSRFDTVAPIDVGLHNPALLAHKSVGSFSLTRNAIVNDGGRSGDYAFRLAGNSSGGGVFYKIADVRIAAKSNMMLRYSLKPGNLAGRNVFVDLLFDDGTLLSEHNGRVIQSRGNT